MSESIYKTVKDYADYKSVSVKTVYNWIKTGEIPKENIKKVLSQILIKI